MNKYEKVFFDALKDSVEASKRLKTARNKLLGKPFSDKSIEEIAAYVAYAYGCFWHKTKDGGVSFCDDLSSTRATRRDDARKFWRRIVLGLQQ